MSYGPEKRTLRLWPFVLLALLIHYVQLTALPLVDFAAGKDSPVESFELELPPDSFARPELTPEEKKQREQEDRTAEGQVVDLPKPAVEKQPEKSRFVSEYDTSVERETRSVKPRGEEAGGAPPIAPPAPQPPTRVAPRQVPNPSALAMRDPSEKPAGQPVEPTQEGPDGVAAGGESPATEGPVRPGPSMQQLRPSDDQLRRAIGAGAGAGDYLADIEEGEDTALNSRRWRFASFFNRIKRQVAENWHPEIAYRRRDPYGNVYGFKDRITILRVSLWPDGSLKDLLLDQPSGVEFLDDEAMQAFRAAQPFLNPPRQLVDPDTGLIAFRFGFIFEINSSPTFRVFRYND